MFHMKQERTKSPLFRSENTVLKVVFAFLPEFFYAEKPAPFTQIFQSGVSRLFYVWHGSLATTSMRTSFVMCVSSIGTEVR